MSYTNLYGQPQGTAAQFTNKLREILVAEVVAINGYQSHIANSTIEEINTAWHSIMLDEKKHYGLILELLRKYDPEQSRQYFEHQKNGWGKSPLISSNTESANYIILNNIREDAKGEFEAVILYEELLPTLPYKDARTTLRSIIDEEKGHAEHLTRLMLKYDPDPYLSLE